MMYYSGLTLLQKSVLLSLLMIHNFKKDAVTKTPTCYEFLTDMGSWELLIHHKINNSLTDTDHEKAKKQCGIKMTKTMHVGFFLATACIVEPIQY